MKVNNNFKAIFSIAFIITLFGAFLKIMHWKYAQPILVIGIALTLAYVFLEISEVNNSKKINKSEKIMWTTGFIFFSFITALIYLLSGRKRII